MDLVGLYQWVAPGRSFAARLPACLQAARVLFRVYPVSRFVLLVLFQFFRSCEGNGLFSCLKKEKHIGTKRGGVSTPGRGKYIDETTFFCGCCLSFCPLCSQSFVLASSGSIHLAVLFVLFGEHQPGWMMSLRCTPAEKEGSCCVPYYIYLPDAACGPCSLQFFRFWKGYVFFLAHSGERFGTRGEEGEEGGGLVVCAAWCFFLSTLVVSIEIDLQSVALCRIDWVNYFCGNTSLLLRIPGLLAWRCAHARLV